MKALILAGGRGKRLGQASESQNKCMLKVSGRPLIEYSLDCAVKAEVYEIIIVVGYMAEEIINAYGNAYKGKLLKYVIQQEQRGVVHAIECSKYIIGDSDFMMMLGDEVLVNPKHGEMVKKYTQEGLFGVCGIVEVEDRALISRTYAIIQGDDKRIFRLIEKPKNPLNNVMGTGNCIFKNEILSYIEQTPINQKRGEKELPDLIQCAIDDGRIVKSFNLCDRYINVNSPVELKEASSYFAHI
ncbi:MAG: NTP transferase domain-containing protein [Deltaproteobacteria bacterium]|nr:NTP transferase domain-containing protein [Deltaproteobacteria bacterium]